MPVTVRLTAAAPAGIAATWYPVDGRLTASYPGPFTVSGAGTHAVLFASVGRDGALEPVETATFKIARQEGACEPVTCRLAARFVGRERGGGLRPSPASSFCER